MHNWILELGKSKFKDTKYTCTLCGAYLYFFEPKSNETQFWRSDGYHEQDSSCELEQIRLIHE